MIQIDLELNGLPPIAAALDRLAKGSFIEQELRRSIPAVGQINKQQFDRNKALPYSASYQGQVKPSGLRRAGGPGDLGYGLDTLALYSDALFSFEADKDSLTNYSDLEYAAYQADLMEAKGSQFYAEDAVYFALLETAIATGVEQAWSQ